MAGGRDVTLTIKVNGQQVDAQSASFARLAAAAKKAGVDIEVSLGVSDSAITKQAKDLQQTLAGSQKSFEDTVRSYKKELLALHQNVRSGSVDQADYQRRLKLLPASLQEAVVAARAMGTGLKDVEKATGTTTKSLWQMITGIEQLQASTGTMGRHLRTAEQGLTSLGSAGGPVVAAVLIVVAVFAAAAYAAVKLGEEIFSLVKGFADYTNSMSKISEETGLTIETASALNSELQKQGRSFTDLNGPINDFRKLVGQAAAGSVDAQKKLSLIGVEPTKAINNMSQAFTSAIDSLRNIKDPAEQARVGVAVFGDQWAKLSLFIKAMPGDFNKITEAARDNGTLVGGPAAQAAKDFARQWAEVQQRAEGVRNTFGESLGPVVIGVLEDIDRWAGRNKESIRDWAETTKSAVKGVIDQFESHPWLFTLGAPGQSSLIAFGAALVTPNAPALPKPGTRDQIEGRTPRSPGQMQTDEVALAAKQAEEEKQAKKRAEELKKALEETKRQADQLRGIITDLELRTQYYGDKTEVAAVKQQIFKMKIQGVNQALADQAVEAAKALDAVQKKAKADEDAKKAAEEFQKTLDAITNAGKQQQDHLSGTLEELRQQVSLGRELTLVEKQTIANKTEQIAKQHELEAANKYTPQQISLLLRELGVQQNITLEIYKQIQAEQEKVDAKKKKDEQIKAFKELQQSIQDQIDEINRGGRPLTVYEQTLKAINKDFADMPEGERKAVLAHAAWIDAVKALQAEYEKVKDTLKNIFDYALRGDFKGLGKSLLDQFRNSLSDKLSGALATVITGYDPNATNNPVAKPIVKEISGTNKRLDQVIKLLGGSAVGGAGLGGGLNLGSLLGGSAGGGIFNLGGGDHAVDSGGHTAGGSAASGSIFGRLRQIFSTGEGGIFAPPTSSGPGSTRLSGILSGVGSIASLVGSAIPGRWGSAISGAGLGLQIGAMFGPIGAAIGAAGGFLLGLFGFSDPKRKADKEQNMPALQKGFTDSMTQLHKILDDIRALRIDPDDAINQATTIRADIASGFGIQFQSKKYRKQSQQMISAQLTQADALISQIRSSAEIARGAADRSKRILPEFAGGYFADFFKPNGLLPGMFDGRDNIFAMISRGEMVINPRQQHNIRALAGFDVFAGAGIPNYPQASSSPKLAAGGIAGAGLTLATQPVINFSPNFWLEIDGVAFDDKVTAVMKSDGGIRTQVKVIKKLQKNGDI